MKHVLFVCSQNRMRSPTAEQLFSTRDDIEVASAGVNFEAQRPLTPELVAWADIIFVMEKDHQEVLQSRFQSYLHHARVICLDIPDVYAFMSPELVAVLNARVPKFLP